MIRGRRPIKPTLVMDNLRFLFMLKILPIKLKIVFHTEAIQVNNHKDSRREVMCVCFLSLMRFFEFVHYSQL